jgi:hypothetical protein
MEMTLAPKCLVGPFLFFVFGCVMLWTAYTGKTVYYAKSRGRRPIPPLEAKVLLTLMGGFFLFLGVWSFLFARCPRLAHPSDIACASKWAHWQLLG